MDHSNALQDVSLLLASIVCIVAVLRALKISSVLGYLIVGFALGPSGLDLLKQNFTTATIAELGIIFLLFVIGLELSFERLKQMRIQVFEVGLAQIAITCIVFAIVAALLEIDSKTAIIIGGGLALSSTAVVIQLLDESGQRSSQVGRFAIAILILQDLAVIPLLVLVQVFGNEHSSIAGALTEAGVKAMVGLTVIVITGHIILRPILKTISGLHQEELFSATILLILAASAYATSAAGLSPALGAFVAGLLIAETEFKPQVEADILPFKNLLLGFFFITVGISVDIPFILAQWGSVLAIALFIMSTKLAVILLLARYLGFNSFTSVYTAFLLCQAGEFALVLFGLAATSNVMSEPLAQLLLGAVTISMLLTPVAKWLGRRFAKIASTNAPSPSRDALGETLDLTDHVIICGFGRVGHIVARLLEAENIPYVALDTRTETVSDEHAKGLPVYYGDASRKLVLKSVGLERAKAVIITYADLQASLGSLRAVRELSPELPIVARAKTIERVQELERHGANLAIAEMFETGLQLGGALMREIGLPDQEISRVIDAFRAEDYALTRGTKTHENPALH